MMPEIIMIRPHNFCLEIFSLRNMYPRTDTQIYPVVSSIGPIESGTPLYEKTVINVDRKNSEYAPMI